MTKRVLLVVTNVAHYDDPSEPTGLWLSGLTHAYDTFAAKGYEQQLISPNGGVSPLEPRALKWPLLDSSAKAAFLADPADVLSWKQRRRQVMSIRRTRVSSRCLQELPATELGS